MVRLTVITVTLNNSDSIEETINSVLSQSYRNIEYIIIDGGSADGTLDILERYKDRIAVIVSGSDNGMYDAMNKGIALAGGDVVGILHADDIYAADDVLAQVAAIFQSDDTDACYGDLIYTHKQDTSRITRFWKAGAYSRSKLYAGWMPPHPTFFARRRCYTDYGVYRSDMGTSADYELMLRLLLRCHVTPVYLPRVLVKMRSGGASNASLCCRLLAHLGDWQAWLLNGLCPLPWTVPLKPLRKLPQWFAKD
jgi:glycosyltransferase